MLSNLLLVKSVHALFVQDQTGALFDLLPAVVTIMMTRAKSRENIGGQPEDGRNNRMKNTPAAPGISRPQRNLKPANNQTNKRLKDTIQSIPTDCPRRQR